MSQQHPYALLASFLILLCTAGGFPAQAARPDQAKDLLPVVQKKALVHKPLVLVEKGKPRFSIAVMAPRSRHLGSAVGNLKSFIEKSTGAKLTVTTGKIAGPSIVIGDCPEARAAGIAAAKLPYDGFTIKTTAEHVFIVGRDEALAGGARSDGSAWGVLEFIERYVGVRWYFPGEIGQSIPKTDTLTVHPVWLTDAPAFRMRVMWPPMSNPWNGTGTPLTPVQTFLRSGNSWPHQLKVHQPNWKGVAEYEKNRPEVFQLRSDGTRDHFMLCYGNPKTLQTYLENIERHFAGKKPARVGIAGDAITVSPNDAEIACYCEHCQKHWNKEGGQWGSGSKVVAVFVAKLAREVKKRWPGKRVIYLPYLNYTLAPDGVTFPDNVEIQIAGMPGIAQYKEPSVLKADQDNIDKWARLSGRKIQNWHYSCWPEDRTKAPYLFPHTVRAFYENNRDKTIGSFINGTTDHWRRQHISLYCWLKVLWNPKFDVDAAIDEYCLRMYGPAAGTMRQLVALQVDGWEKSRWSGGRLSPKAIHEISYPRKTVQQMELLLKKARDQAKDDKLVLARLDYYAGPFADFFKASKNFHSGTGLKPLLVQKVGENPKLDGRLDDAVWKRATANAFVRGWDEKQTKPTYPTAVRAVWTFEGVTFGFEMQEPTPDRLERIVKGRDDSMAWWDDNIELLFDVTGKNEGEYYHLIINSNAAVADAKEKDFSWNNDQIKTAAQVGKKGWTLEVYVPYKALPNAIAPGPGRPLPTWMGNFTRHRVADRGLANRFKGRQQIQPNKGSVREYQRMNTTYAKPSNNLTDFAPLKFVE